MWGDSQIVHRLLELSSASSENALDVTAEPACKDASLGLLQNPDEIDGFG